MTLRALIVDDEPIGRRRLRALLKGEADIEVVGECEDGNAALEAVRRLRPDLMFLDVQMPGLDGFDVIELLKGHWCPAVIFVTAYDRYAMRAFDVHAVDYLLKPFERSRLKTAIGRAVALAGHADASKRLQAMVESIRAAELPRRFLVKTPSRVYAVRADDVESIEAAGHYVELRSSDGRAHLLRESMNAIVRRIARSRFARIHRSTIVNIDKIKELQPAFHGEYTVTLHSGRRLQCSRTYAADLARVLST